MTAPAQKCRVHTYTHAYTRMHVRKNVNGCGFSGNTHSFTHPHIHTYTHTYAHTHTRTHTHTHVRTYIHTHTRCCGPLHASAVPATCREGKWHSSSWHRCEEFPRFWVTTCSHWWIANTFLFSLMNRIANTFLGKGLESIESGTAAYNAGMRSHHFWSYLSFTVSDWQHTLFCLVCHDLRLLMCNTQQTPFCGGGLEFVGNGTAARGTGVRNRHFLFYHLLGVGQNHIYTVCIRVFWQGNHQDYSQLWCIYTASLHLLSLTGNILYSIGEVW